MGQQSCLCRSPPCRRGSQGQYHKIYLETIRTTLRQVSQVVESAFCSCATFTDADTLVTGSTDNMVRLWHVLRNSQNRDQPVTLQLTHQMRGHTARVSAVTASRAWSLIVSGSKDGSAALWDLNRGVYTRSIWHGAGEAFEVHLVAINESTVRYLAACFMRWS